MIYLDNAATTHMLPEVISEMERSHRDDFANAGTVYAIGHDAKQKLSQMENDISRLLRLPPGFNLVFTSGGSESNNLFIKGLAFPDKKTACLGLEHPSITETLYSLKEFGNPPVSLLKFQKEGRLEPGEVSRFAEERIRLLCLSHVNNELGIINDIPGIAHQLKRHSPQTRLFVDGVQAVGKWNYTPEFWDHLAGYSLSAHKFHGPKGIGLLAYDSRIQLKPLIHGGGQQGGVRSGTLPLPLITGLHKALRIAVERTQSSLEHFHTLYAQLVEGLKNLAETNPDLKVKFNSRPVSDGMHQSPSICNFSFTPVEGEVLLHHLEAQKIYVGLGSACSAHSKEPSKILLGMACTKEEALCSLRVSFSFQNTREDVDRFVKEFGQAWSSLYPAFSDRLASK